MREIKFRAWIKDEGRMDYSPDLTDYDGARRWFNAIEDLDWRIDIVSLMQYTGLKDKNGKEIYEGDIVRVGNGDIGEVKWDNVHTGFGIVGEKDGPYVVGFMYYGEMKQEIIGNIYENPDLLEGK